MYFVSNSVPKTRKRLLAVRMLVTYVHVNVVFLAIDKNDDKNVTVMKIRCAHARQALDSCMVLLR